MYCRNPSARPRPSVSGFTLLELLVVIVIILLVSVLVLPAVISSLSDRQVSEAARILQGGLVGARLGDPQQCAEWDPPAALADF